MTDIVIVGAGPAGLTAALYAKRAGHEVLVLESAVPGGQAVGTPHVENWPGTLGITGPDFALNLAEQARHLEIPIRSEKATAIRDAGEQKIVLTGEGSYECSAVILANGLLRRKLEIPGEERLGGRGVSYCAVCDGNFFRGKAVAVVGGGNTAVEDASYLASICTNVTLIHRRAELRAEEHLVRRAREIPNLNMLLGHTVTEITGDTRVEALTVSGEEGARELAVSGIFVAVGFLPENAAFAPPVQLDEGGFIVAGEDCATGVPGIFAAGDCRVKELRQLVTAAADGAIAANRAGKYLLTGK